MSTDAVEQECCLKIVTKLPAQVSRKDAEHTCRQFLKKTRYDAFYVQFRLLKVILVCFDSKRHQQIINKSKKCESLDCKFSKEFVYLKKKRRVIRCTIHAENTFCKGLNEIRISYEDLVRHCHKNRMTSVKAVCSSPKYVKSRETIEADTYTYQEHDDQVYDVDVNLRKGTVTQKSYEGLGENDDQTYSVSKVTDRCLEKTSIEHIHVCNVKCDEKNDNRRIYEESQITTDPCKIDNNEIEPSSGKQNKTNEESGKTIDLNECRNTDFEVKQKPEKDGHVYEKSSYQEIANVFNTTTTEVQPQIQKEVNQVEDSGQTVKIEIVCKTSSNLFRSQSEKENKEVFYAENAWKQDRKNVIVQRDKKEILPSQNTYQQDRGRSKARDEPKRNKNNNTAKRSSGSPKDEKYKLDVMQEDQELMKKCKKGKWKEFFKECKVSKTKDLWKNKLIDFLQKHTQKEYFKEHFLKRILQYERFWNIEILAFPAKKSKSGKSARRRSQDRQNQSSQQDRQNQSSQGAEGGPDHYSVQVSEAETDGLSLPSGDRVVTSTSSVFRPPTSTSGPSPTTNQLSVDAERNLLSRIRRQLPASRFSTPPQPARHPQYSDQPSRQRSYTNWPSSTGQDPARMAVYGLFYTGRFDLVRCFQCGIGLKDWSGTDEPLFEHIRHSGECPFLKDLLGQDLLNAYKENLRSNQVPATNPAGSSSGQASGRVRNPQYSDLQARIRSFLSWPASNLQRPEVLAEAGLFFTGTNDLCRCFTCDGGLQRWDSDDDPWIEHARWFPQCAYVRQIKGQDYIDMVQQAAAAAREEEDPIVFPPGQSREGPIEQRMEELSLQRRDPLSTPEALRVIGMGYSRKAVLLAIHEFSGRSLGARNDFTYEDLVGILREREQRGEALPPDSPQDSTGVNLEVLAENMDPEELNRHLRGILKCMRCEVNDSNILFLPCTHHRMCEECAVEVTVCPICGRKVDDKIRTFMS